MPSQNIQFFIHQNGQQAGPFTVDEIWSMLAARSIAPTDLGWHEGLLDWQPLNTFLPKPAPLSAAVPAIAPSPAKVLGKAVPTNAPVSAKSPAQPRIVKRRFYQQPFVWGVVTVLALLLVIYIGVHLYSTSSGSSATNKTFTAAQLANSLRIEGTVVQVIRDGLLVTAEIDFGVASSSASVGGGGNVYVPSDPHGKGRPRKLYGTFLIVGHPKHDALADDANIDVDAYEDGVFTFTTRLHTRRTVKKYTVVKAFE